MPFAIGGLLLGGVLFQRRGLLRDVHRFPPTGRLIQTPAGTLHVHETNQVAIEPGAPTVILESGLAGSSLSWIFVQEEIAGFARVCSYDRSGFGWSSPSESPRTLAAVVDELHQVLNHAQLPPPYILVGHSFGGLIVRTYAKLHPESTAGLVLVDPISTKYWASCGAGEAERLQRGIRLAHRGALLARLGLIRLILNLLIAGRRFLPQAVARLSAPGATSFLQRLTREIQKLPPALWPVVRAQWSRPMGFYAIRAYLVSLQSNCLQAESEPLDSSVPLTILSASTATAAEVSERVCWLVNSRRGRHIAIPDSGHWIQVEQPAAVAEAVRQMVRAGCNKRSSLPPVV